MPLLGPVIIRKLMVGYKLLLILLTTCYGLIILWVTKFQTFQNKLSFFYKWCLFLTKLLYIFTAFDSSALGFLEKKIVCLDTVTFKCFKYLISANIRKLWLIKNYHIDCRSTSLRIQILVLANIKVRNQKFTK